MRGQESGSPFSVTASGTDRAIATKAGVAGVTLYVTEISGSVDASTSTVLSPTIILKQGTTVLWQDLIPIQTSGSARGTYIKNFNMPLSSASGASMSVEAGSATSISYANIAGYSL